MHFDPHLTINFKTNNTLSFVYSKLVRHKVGGDIRPGTFIVEPDLAERWETPDETTYIFHLRQGVKWHNKPPVNGRELVAEDVKFTFDRFRAEKGNADRYILELVDTIEVVDRYTVKFVLKEPYVWLIDVLANLRSMRIVASLDAVQLAQRYLKDVGIEAALKVQEYGAYMATTFLGKFEGMAMGPVSIAWEPDSVLYGMYAPDQPRNRGHVNDRKLAAMVKEQRRLKDPEARKQLIFDIQRYAAEQQYYVYLSSAMITSSWQPYMKSYAHNLTFDYGGRVAALWLDR